MIVAPMKQSAYNFERCKLCGQWTAAPRYQLAEGNIYSCTTCDFHFLDVLDSQENPPQKTALDDKSRHYIDSRRAENRLLSMERIKFISRHRRIDAIKALDIGAGLGEFKLLLEAEKGSCFGIEPSHLRRQYAAEKFGATLYPELTDSPFWQQRFPEYFALITLWDVIEHVNFPRETLHAAANLLKPGGLLCLETPDREAIAYRLSQTACQLSGGKITLFLPNFYSAARYGHKQIFTRNQLVGLLNKVGFDIIEIRRSYLKQLAPGNKIILAAQKR